MSDISGRLRCPRCKNKGYVPVERSEAFTEHVPCCPVLKGRVEALERERELLERERDALRVGLDKMTRLRKEWVKAFGKLENANAKLREVLEGTALHLAAYLEIEMTDAQEDGDLYEGGLKALNKARDLLRGEEEK